MVPLGASGRRPLHRKQNASWSACVLPVATTSMSPPSCCLVMEADLVDGRHGRAESPCLDQPGRISCGVECDGGGFDITPGADGMMLVDFGRKGNVLMSSVCANGGSGDFRLEPSAEESPFVLQPMDEAACQASHLAVVYPEPEVD